MWQFAHYNGREKVSDITSTLQDKQETTAQMQATVISDISSKQLLPVQRQTSVTAYLKSEQLLRAFFFAADLFSCETLISEGFHGRRQFAADTLAADGHPCHSIQSNAPPGSRT